ncbi:hypothetical protein OPIT5_26005 [Opitutaceae bacterium TAV5]|nr:hypothetical protein OPIT5_26005 [Opitutaceae bacterium TAV5]
MKTRSILLPFLLTAITSAICLITRADVSYTWTPDGTASGAASGGSGTWDNGAHWWDGTAAQALGSTTTPFGSATENAILNFYGTGTIIKQFTANFGSSTARTHTLNFADGSDYTLLAITGGAWIGGGTGHIVWNIDASARLTVGGDGNQIALVSGSTVSDGPGLVFSGGGTVDLKSGALLRNNSANSRLTVRDGTTLNFGTGSLYTGPGGTLSTDPADGSRISLENGVINVNGGTVTTGYAGTNTVTTSRGFGIAIGATTTGGGTATFNLDSGTVTAIGDPRGETIAHAGVAFGISASNNGGTFNLNGGTLITTNIRAAASTGANAILNLNGGTIVVSTALSAPDDSITDGQLQTRLDNFITGFANSTTNHVIIGSNGVTFDTSQIDTTRTNGVASINAVMRGSGDLKKIGGNTLRLAGANTYTGKTIIRGGTLALGSAGSITNSEEIVIDNDSVFDVSARDAGFSLATGQVISTTSRGRIIGNINTAGGRLDVDGALSVDGNLDAGTGTLFAFDLGNIDSIVTVTGDLVLASGAILDLGSSSAFGEGSYTLFKAASITGTSLTVASGAPAGFSYSFTHTGTSLLLNVTAVPEPATSAVLAGILGLVATAMCRRR